MVTMRNFQVPKDQIKIEFYKLKKIQFIYTLELAHITVNSANRTQKAATVEMTQVHNAVGQRCT